MKRLICFLLSCILVLSLFPCGVIAASQTMLTVSSASANRGDIVNVKVNISSGSGMQACDFELYYDTTVLEIVSATKGDNLKASPIINTSILGKIIFSYAATSATTTAGTLLNVQFKIKTDAAYGQSNLNLNCKDLSDGSFNDIDYSVKSGNITVIAPQLEPPYSMEVTQTTDTAVSLYWSSIDEATGYNLYLNGVRINDEPVAENAYNIVDLQPDTEYTLQITAMHYTVESEKSESFIIRTAVEMKNVYFFYMRKADDGTVLYDYMVMQLVNGTVESIPEVPAIDGYVFKGWDKDLSKLSANDTVWAEYDVITPKITFVDWDGTVLSEQTVSYGGAAEAPANPTRDGYVFTMWDRSFDNVTEDITVTAQYMEITCAHKNVETQGMVKSTCTVNGYSGNVVCSDCNSVIMTGSELPLADHSYNAVVTKPTPSAQGYTTHTCTVCGHSYVDSYVDYVDENAPQLVLESKQVTKGKEFTVAVQFKNNPGFSYLEVTPIIAPELTLVKVTNGNLAADFTKGKQYVWVGDGDVTADGLLMTFTFSVADSVAFGTYQVDFNVRTCANYDEEVLELAVVKADIEVIDCAYGDINGDGAIDGLDVIRLKKYLANYDYETESSDVEISAGADANGDGVIDGLDVIRLKKYLANYDYETGESTVVLGPQ